MKRGEEKFIFIYYSTFDARFEQRAAREGIKLDLEDWKKTPVKVADGGRGYFRVLYDVQRKSYVWYECNGIA